MRHWHTHEEEFVFVIEGEVVLCTDAGEQTLVAGSCAGSRLGEGRPPSGKPQQPAAVYLEVGTRDDADAVVYPDVDLIWNPAVHPDRSTHRDGTPY